MDRPDERSVMTYVAQFVYKYPEVRSYSGDSLTAIQEKYDEFVSWLTNRSQFMSNPQNISNNFSVILFNFNSLLYVCNLVVYDNGKNRFFQLFNSVGFLLSIYCCPFHEVLFIFNDFLNVFHLRIMEIDAGKKNSDQRFFE